MESTKPRRKHTPKSHAAQQKEQVQDQALDSSVHSKASATSAGTTFTKEDGLSLFTSLTESFMSDMKSQSEAMIMAMVEQQQLDRQEQKEEQRLLKIEHEEQQAEQRQERTEQRRLNAQTDARFLQMLQVFTQQTTLQGIPPSPLPPPWTIVISPTAVAASSTPAVRPPHTSVT